MLGGGTAVARLGAVPVRLTAEMAVEATRIGGELRAAVERNLSGAVLRQRSGRLASSIDLSVQPRGGGVTASLGTDVPYAAIHEYGGTLPARTILPRGGRALAFPWQGRERFFKRVSLLPVTMPERSFLRAALAEMEPDIRATMAAAVARGVSA